MNSQPHIQVFLAEEGTYQEFPAKRKDQAAPVFFIERSTGKRILAVHGLATGEWPSESAELIQKMNPDMIFCCHPRQMKKLTGDERIQGNHESPTYALAIKYAKGGVVTIYH